MSIVVRFSPIGLTADQYEGTIRALEDDGGFPQDGMTFHSCFGTEGDLRVTEVWDSREQLEAFGERLMPVLADAGVEFSGPPEILEVHRIITP